MSTVEWRDWSCTVRVVLADGRAADQAPSPALAASVRRSVGALMDDVARSASRFRDDSDLARVNAAAGRLVVVRPLTITLVEAALDAARRTDGACDPTVGRHLVAAGYDRDIALLTTSAPGSRGPSDATPPPAADWRGVRVDPTLGRVGLRRGLGLDLGATAKAWTADRAAARLAGELDLPVLVSLGGDVATSGHGPDWLVTVAEVAGGPGQLVSLGGGAVATSSTVARRWPVGDRAEAHHLIDPRTGRPTTGPFRTASVAADTCVLANALSTAALVWGAEAPARLRDHPARLVPADGHPAGVVTTGAWPTAQVAA